MKILKLFVLGVMLAVPAMASAADPLPKGSIAISESEMTLADAKAFCQQQGGRLPRINGSDSWRMERRAWDAGVAIDGFGVGGSPWPSGLQSDWYWTGTKCAVNPSTSWNVHDDDDGGIHVSNHHPQRDVYRVVCVP